MKMYEIYWTGVGAMWLGKPIPSTKAIKTFIGEIGIRTKYVHVIKPIAPHRRLDRFFDMIQEKDQFVEFMFEASWTHEILGVCLDDDARGSNLELVIGESPSKTNIDDSVIECILKKFKDEGY